VDVSENHSGQVAGIAGLRSTDSRIASRPGVIYPKCPDCAENGRLGSPKAAKAVESSWKRWELPTNRIFP